MEIVFRLALQVDPGRASTQPGAGLSIFGGFLNARPQTRGETDRLSGQMSMKLVVRPYGGFCKAPHASSDIFANIRRIARFRSFASPYAVMRRVSILPRGQEDAAVREIDFFLEAEFFPPRLRNRSGRRFNYRRFDSTAEAIRYAIEELPVDVLSGSIIEAAEERFDAKVIRELYDSSAYPLVRRASAPSS